MNDATDADRRSALDIDAGPAAVGVLVAAAGVLFLVDPVVGPVSLGGLRARPVALSAVVLAAGFGLGAAVFSRRGHRRFAFAHAVFGLAWAGVVVGTAVGSGLVVVAAVLLVVAGSGALLEGARRSRG